MVAVYPAPVDVLSLSTPALARPQPHYANTRTINNDIERRLQPTVHRRAQPSYPKALVRDETTDSPIAPKFPDMHPSDTLWSSLVTEDRPYGAEVAVRSLSLLHLDGSEKECSSVVRDDLTAFIGAHGPYQSSTFQFGLLVAFVLPLQAMIPQILTPEMDYWCARSSQFGRKPVIQASVLAAVICATAIVFCRSLHAFLAVRFLLGGAMTTLLTTTFVLVVEVISPDVRSIYGIAVLVGHGRGNLVMSFLSWLRINWHVLQFIAVIPAVMMLQTSYTITESPRWLIATTRIESVEAIVMHAARMNGENVMDVRMVWTRAKRETTNRGRHIFRILHDWHQDQKRHRVPRSHGRDSLCTGSRCGVVRHCLRSKDRQTRSTGGKPRRRSHFLLYRGYRLCSCPARSSLIGRTP